MFLTFCTPIRASSSPVVTPRPFAPSDEYYQRYLTSMRELVSEAPSLTWKSRFIDSDAKVGATKAVNLVEQVFLNPKFQAEIAGVLDSLGGPTSPKVWNIYFQRCYNAIECLTHGYIQLLLESSRYLPKSGVIFDCGGGPGNFSTTFLSMSPERTVRMFDMSSTAIRLARRTARHFGVEKRLKVTKTNLKEDFAEKASANGIVLNNVLYTLGPKDEKLAFLKKLNRLLKPGGILVLNDPLPALQTKATSFSHLVQVVSGAAYHKSPMTAYDVALYTEINRKVLVAKSCPFLSANGLVALANGAGFAVIEAPETRFYGIDTFLVLRKNR